MVSAFLISGPDSYSELNLNTSAPEPPVRVSFPRPPIKVSFPAKPDSLSAIGVRANDPVSKSSAAEGRVLISTVAVWGLYTHSTFPNLSV